MTFTEAQLATLIASVFWPFVRIASMFAAAPVFSNKQIPNRVKLLLAISVTFVVAPVLDPPPVVNVFSAEAILILFQQMAIGVIIGFSLQLALATLTVAGEMIGYSMKLGMAKMADPINGVQVPIVATLYITLALLIILSLDIHLMMIQLIIDSFIVFPVATDGITRNTLWDIISWTTRLYELGLLMALPVIGSILLLDIAMGIMSRSAPQIQIFAIGFPITLIVGLVLIWLTLPSIMHSFIAAMDELLLFVREVIMVSP